MAELILKPRRERSLLGRHPWIFSGAVGGRKGDLQPGETVEVLSSENEWLARAAYSPTSQIRARVWTFDREEAVDADFFRRRIERALLLRSRTGLSTSASGESPGRESGAVALRLVNAESDALPGLIVDRYAATLVLQALTVGIEYWKQTIADLLLELTGLRDIFERSPDETRELEGLEGRTGALRGEPPGRTTIEENGLRFAVDLERGHKTGFYLDQRENRQLVRSLASGREALDCFCYTGGFALNALAGGANQVVAMDASAEALALGRENAALNALDEARLQWMEGDVFRVLRAFRDQGRTFDLVVLDPPKFAPTAARAGKAARGYKDINLLAFKLLRPEGILVTFSCSGGVNADLFQKIVFSAALDAGADAQIVKRLGQPPDHPVGLSFPEGAYLKGLVCVKAS
jgi:23S rRNA (cytosine1962-C5)-methyltransferase